MRPVGWGFAGAAPAERERENRPGRGPWTGEPLQRAGGAPYATVRSSLGDFKALSVLNRVAVEATDPNRSGWWRKIARSLRVVGPSAMATASCASTAPPLLQRLQGLGQRGEQPHVIGDRPQHMGADGHHDAIVAGLDAAAGKQCGTMPRRSALLRGVLGVFPTPLSRTRRAFCLSERRFPRYATARDGLTPERPRSGGGEVPDHAVAI